MKIASLSLLCGICFISFARADLTIVQKVEGPGQSGDVTIKIKGEKERIESASQPIRIIDGKSGEMLNLMNDQKAFVRISAEQMKAAAETIAKFDGKNQTAERPKLTPTGKKETVNGYETDQYVYETPKFKATFWVATKYPDAASILKQMQAPISEVWKPSNMGMPEYRDFPGVPIKTVVSLGGNEVTTTLTSLKQDPLSDAEFSVPKDFQEVKPPETGEALRPSEKKSPAESPAKP